eukprot:TRINITY_DN6018_c0_g1_i2.p1 TRINITY_DN6018_c0_g1~~TRINITY_DN6018_c0_g1_i2.p1  ORF type:complete len:227 (+),score=43.55 TRINITY_DN6018_c0_g1_i2:42-722(+)
MSNGPETSLYEVTSADTGLFSGPSPKAELISTLDVGSLFIIGQFKKDGACTWGRLEAMKGWCKVGEMTRKGDPPKVECVVCGSSPVGWKDWLQHKKSKKHKQNFERNPIADPPESLDAANDLLEQAAIMGDPSISEGLKPVEVKPPEGCGRWGGAPPEKKEKEPKKEETEEEQPLSEMQLDWLKKAEARRVEFEPGTYNASTLPVVTTKPPDHVPAFGAGRGKIIN